MGDKVKFKNIAAGPRGIQGKDGVVMVEPGQTLEIELADDKGVAAKTIELAKKGGSFAVDGALSAEAKKTVDEGKQNAPTPAAADMAAGAEVEKTYTADEMEKLRETAKGMGLKPRQDWTGAKLEKAIADKQAKGG